MSDEQNNEETESPEAQLSLELPEFEGHHPVGVVTRLNGAGQRITRALGIEDKVVLLVEAKVSDVGHKTTKDGIKRVHTLAVSDLWEMEGKAGRDLLGKTRRKFEADMDAKRGVSKLPGTDPHHTEGVTLDENGTALTDDEAAAARGDVLPEGKVKEMVVVFDDGSRASWPGDWTDDEAEADLDHPPKAGSEYMHPAKGFQYDDVKELLDAETGDTIEWTQG